MSPMLNSPIIRLEASGMLSIYLECEHGVPSMLIISTRSKT